MTKQAGRKYVRYNRALVLSTGGPRYMREIGTKILGSHIMNFHLKRPTIPIN
jgi:hypothetical protein